MESIACLSLPIFLWWMCDCLYYGIQVGENYLILICLQHKYQGPSKPCIDEMQKFKAGNYRRVLVLVKECSVISNPCMSQSLAPVNIAIHTLKGTTYGKDMICLYLENRYRENQKIQFKEISKGLGERETALS